MPWAMPPCCWPGDEHRVEDAARVVDGDVAAQRDLPVSRSTSTTAMWEPNGKLDWPCLKSSSWSIGAAAPSSRCPTRPPTPSPARAQVTSRSAMPFTPKPPSVCSMSSTPASSRCAAISLARAAAARRGVDRAAGGLQRARAQRAGALRHQRGVGLDELDLVHRHAEDARSDLRVGGLVTLAVRARAGHDRDTCRRGAPRRAVLADEPQRGGDLDVRGDADAHGGRLPSARRAPARRADRRSRRATRPRRAPSRTRRCRSRRR